MQSVEHAIDWPAHWDDYGGADATLCAPAEIPRGHATAGRERPSPRRRLPAPRLWSAGPGAGISGPCGQQQTRGSLLSLLAGRSQRAPGGAHDDADPGAANRCPTPLPATGRISPESVHPRDGAAGRDAFGECSLCWD